MPNPTATRPGPAVAALREATAADHQNVDARFGRFTLANPEDYARFLTAHAIALPVIETVLAGDPRLPALRPRAALIAQDLAALGKDVPAPWACNPPVDAAEAFGMAYVIEGSRLGGAMMARSLPANLPATYLSAAHQPGEWRDLLLALENAATDEAWIARAIAAASRTFHRYGEAADAV